MAPGPRRPYLLLAVASSEKDWPCSMTFRLMPVILARTISCAPDGMVLARSAFESSMHYRSAMVFGTAFGGISLVL